MLPAVRDVARGLLRDIGNDMYYTLEHISKAVEAYTPVSSVFYVEYDVPSSNPILGQFRKYSHLPSAYASVETVVEVRYASHLDLPWKRFVVAKELCHSLESDKGTHSATGRALDRLLSRFSLLSAQKPIDTSFPAFDAEGFAEIGAIELICPLETRRRVLGTESSTQLSIDYGLPLEYGRQAFDEEYNDIVESIFEDFR